MKKKTEKAIARAKEAALSGLNPPIPSTTSSSSSASSARALAATPSSKAASRAPSRERRPPFADAAPSTVDALDTDADGAQEDGSGGDDEEENEETSAAGANATDDERARRKTAARADGEEKEREEKRTDTDAEQTSAPQTSCSDWSSDSSSDDEESAPAGKAKRAKKKKVDAGKKKAIRMKAKLNAKDELIEQMRAQTDQLAAMVATLVASGASGSTNREKYRPARESMMPKEFKKANATKDRALEELFFQLARVNAERGVPPTDGAEWIRMLLSVCDEEMTTWWHTQYAMLLKEGREPRDWGEIKRVLSAYFVPMNDGEKALKAYRDLHIGPNEDGETFVQKFETATARATSQQWLEEDRDASAIREFYVAFVESRRYPFTRSKILDYIAVGRDMQWHVFRSHLMRWMASEPQWNGPPPTRKHVSPVQHREDGKRVAPIGDGSCAKCGEKGHNAYACTSTTIEKRICWGCGKPGHLRPDCPDAGKKKGAPKQLPKNE